ncbi:MAG: hypothetical protein ACLP1Q_07240 [Solirubrobacteraceae bacterium]
MAVAPGDLPLALLFTAKARYYVGPESQVVSELTRAAELFRERRERHEATVAIILANYEASLATIRGSESPDDLQRRYQRLGQAHSLFKKYRDPVGQSIALITMAAIDRELELWDLARDKYTLALTTLDQPPRAGDEHRVVTAKASGLVGLALIYFLRDKDYTAARAMATRALATARELGSTNLEGDCRRLMAMVTDKEGNTHAARAQLTKLLEFHKAAGDALGERTTTRLLAALHLPPTFSLGPSSTTTRPRR